MRSTLKALWFDWGLILLLLGLVTYAIGIAKLVMHVAQPGSLPLIIIGLATAALLGYRVKYSKQHAPSSTAIRAISLSLTLYLLAAAPSFDYETHSYAVHQISYFHTIKWIAFVGGIVSLWRPSFALLPAAGVVTTKSLSLSILGLPSLSQTDYLPVVEFLAILTLGLMFSSMLMHYKRRISDQLNWEKFSDYAPYMLFMFAVAIHFGNYFHSGVTKLLLDGPFLNWLDNTTPAIMEIADIAGHVPISLFPELANEIHKWMLENYLLTNLITLLTQIASIFLLKRISWTAWLTAFYDLTHIVIALITGIFFWKWILLNFVIVAGLVSIRKIRIDWPSYTVLAVTVIVGQAVYFNAKLGWYDTQGFVHHYFEVVTVDGEIARVPSNFFMTGSITVAQNRMGTPTTKHFPIRTWGSTRNHAVNEMSRDNCSFDPAYHYRYPFNPDWLSNYVRSHHHFVLNSLRTSDDFKFDLFPHHIFSVPWSYTDFYQLDLKKVTRYHYVVESICINGVFGDQQDRRLKRDIRTIDVNAISA